MVSELQPRVKDWLLACVDGKTGLIPANYVKVLGKRRGTAIPQTQMIQQNSQIQSIPNTTTSQTGSQVFQPEEFLSERPIGQSSSQGSNETSSTSSQQCCSGNRETQVPTKQCCSKSDTQNQEQPLGLPQTSSALNLEKQAHEGFTGDNSNLDSLLPEEEER